MRRIRFPELSDTSSSPPILAQRLANRLAVSEPVVEATIPKKLGGLVLTRHLGESLMVGDDVLIEVVGLKSGTARLKIVAPRTIAVHRREVYDEIRTNPQSDRFLRPEPTEVAPAPPTDRPLKAKGGLVLTRNVFQSIMIGDEVELTVVEVRSTTVKIKIVAPRTVSVHRREVYEAIQGDRG